MSFLFSANTSTPLQPVAQVASGGEIARVMLSLKAMISGAVKLPTIIFDEIDTGVSGKIAEKMAEMMQEMGSYDRQVISITHLPQIAALGSPPLPRDEGGDRAGHHQPHAGTDTPTSASARSPRCSAAATSAPQPSRKRKELLKSKKNNKEKTIHKEQ